MPPPPILILPLDIDRFMTELAAQREAVEEELRRIEEAKKVTAETMRLQIDF